MHFINKSPPSWGLNCILYTISPFIEIIGNRELATISFESCGTSIQYKLLGKVQCYKIYDKMQSGVSYVPNGIVVVGFRLT